MGRRELVGFSSQSPPGTVSWPGWEGRWPGSLSLGFAVQVAQEIWVCEKQTITKWPGDILAYKEHLKSKLVGEEPQPTRRTHNV